MYLSYADKVDIQSINYVFEDLSNGFDSPMREKNTFNEGDVKNTFPSKLPKFFEALKKLLRSVFNASKNFGTFMLRVVHKPVQSEQIRFR